MQFAANNNVNENKNENKIDIVDINESNFQSIAISDIVLIGESFKTATKEQMLRIANEK